MINFIINIAKFNKKSVKYHQKKVGNMKKTIFAFIIMLSLNALALASNAPVESQTKSNKTPSVRSQNLSVDKMKEQNKTLIKMVVEEISKKLPQVVDKYTKFTKISNEDLTLIYTFEIDTGDKNDDDVIKQSEDRMRRVITKGICQSSSRFLNADIDISYRYINANTKTKLFRFDVTKKDCVGIK